MNLNGFLQSVNGLQHKPESLNIRVSGGLEVGGLKLLISDQFQSHRARCVSSNTVH